MAAVMTMFKPTTPRNSSVMKKERKSQRFAPYSSKRPALPEFELYLESMDSADETDVETPSVFEEDFVRLSIDEEFDMDPSLSMEWSPEDLSILLALFSKDVKM
ncbi:hypothetical protein THRCLA_22195 [Thraustotheca clavata]|uniref:Uncharacterized protein n=1 Tax=Thraustotheca clavata TaxID=74557 RepID=A0A1V9ZAK6_9STRA|nr:hypothetical protein THRCLA_22195 [Thraustotheca clavata]